MSIREPRSERHARDPDQGRSDQSAYENEQVHNRWHPDIPMACWVKPGDDFILETYDWTGGFIKNDDSADDVRDIDLSIVHFLSGPVGVHGAEPGDLLVVDLLDIGAKADQWGFNGFFRSERRRLSDRSFPRAEVDLGLPRLHSSRHIPGVNFAGLIHPGLIGCLPDRMLETWNAASRPDRHRPERVPPLANPPFAATAHMGKLAGDARDKAARKAPAPCRRASTAATATSRICRAARRSSSRSTMARACRWATCTSARATARSPSAAPSKWPAGCTCA
jgi:hypothetical protein